MIKSGVKRVLGSVLKRSFEGNENLQKEVGFLHGEIASLRNELQKSNQSEHPLKFQEKVFCIGMLKTGTTSMETLFKQLGYDVGDQGAAERQMKNWARRNWLPLLEYCKKSQAFQDVPFAFPMTYVALDAYFPKSKFILTVREDEDIWYSSYIRFTKKIIAERFGIPLEQALQVANVKRYDYRYAGYLFEVQRCCFGVGEDEIYDAEIYKRQYLKHIADVKDYFRFTEDKLLVVGLHEPKAKERICSFLKVPNDGTQLPRLNVS